MKKVFHVIAVLVLTCSLLPSCKMRPQDAERLKAEAENGNLKSIEVLAANGGELITQSERERYIDILVNNGNYRALAGKFNDEIYRSGRLSEAQQQAMYMRWMEKGARMGTPDCMYRLGMMYLEKAHLDSTKARFWLGQAADSLQAASRVELRKMAGERTVLDEPVYAFQQMWGYNCREQSFLNRASNAVFHFFSSGKKSTWKCLFGSTWWQSLLMVLAMIIVLSIGVICVFGKRGEGTVSVAVSGIYGWLNGTLLLVFNKAKSSIPGILVSSDAIGQFSRQPATYGLISDICIWGSWCCLAIIILMYLRGLLLRFQVGHLTVWRFFTYTFGTVFSCAFIYFLSGALSTLTWIIGVTLLVAFILGGFGREWTAEEWKAHEAEWAAQAEANRRAAQERERKKKDEDRWEWQQRAWDRDKNA